MEASFDADADASPAAAERDAGASARREAKHGYRHGRVYPARASLPGRARDAIAGEMTKAAVASTAVAARTTKGMLPGMPRAQQVSIFIVVLYCPMPPPCPFLPVSSLPFLQMQQQREV